MRLLVTGGAGFIGSTFVHHVLHASGVAPAGCCPDAARYGHDDGWPDATVLNVDKLTYAADRANLVGVDDDPAHRLAVADICDAPAMDALVREFEPDAIVHFAAESHVDRSIEAGEVFVRTNVLGTQTLLDVARRRDVPRFLHVGTDEVYGSVERGSSRPGDPLAPSSPYSASKAASDLLVLAHCRTYGLHALVTRCTNNYGPRQHPEKMLPKAITRALERRPIPVYGDGMQSRDWLYARDHCAALVVALRRGRAGEVIHVGGRDERTNLDLARTVLKALERPDTLVEHVADRPGHDRRYSLDDSALRALGWHPRMPFHEGLRHTAAWYARGATA